MKTSRPHCYRRASLPAILEEVLPSSQQSDGTENNCSNGDDKDTVGNSHNLTLVGLQNGFPRQLFTKCDNFRSKDQSSETSSCETIIPVAEGNEDSGTGKRNVNLKRKKPFKKMASEPILGHHVDPGNSDQVLSRLGIHKGNVSEWSSGRTLPEREMPTVHKDSVNSGYADIYRWVASSDSYVKPEAGRSVLQQSVFVNESFVGDAGIAPEGAPPSGEVSAGPEADHQPRPEPASERRRLAVGLLCLSAAFLLHFTAHAGAVGLQSTLHAGSDLGTRALAVQCGVLILSCALLPSLLIRHLGYKWTVAGSMALYAPFVLLQLWPRPETLLPAAALMGVGSGPLWSAKSAYVSAAARRWAQLAGQPAEHAQLRFFSIFFAIYNFSFITGNTVSLLILTSGGTEVVGVEGELCGANFCPSDRGAAANPNFRTPPHSQLAALFGVLAACIACAVLLVAVGLHQLQSDLEEEDYGARAALRLVGAAARLHRDPVQLLLAPITVFTGLTQAVLNADFTEAFVSCSWGIPHIGGVLACYGAANCAASAALGWRGRSASHAALLSGYAACYCLLLAALFLWRPAAGEGATFYLLAVFWGVADCGILVLNSVCGIMFRGRERAAYSNLRMWETVGFLYGYATSPLLCMRAKLMYMAALLAAGVCGYWAAAYLAHRRALTSFRLHGEQNNQQETRSTDK